MNNRKYGPFTYVNNIAFSPDGKTLVYSTRESNDSYYVYAYGNRRGPFHVVSFLTFLPDGTLLYKTHDKQGGIYIHKGNKTEGPFRDDDIDDPTYSPDGKIFAYTSGSPYKRYLCVGDSEKVGPFDYIHNITFSPDSTNIAYSATTNNHKYIYVGSEKIGGPFDFVNQLTFFNDNKTLSFNVMVDDISYSKIYMNGKMYTGAICGNKIVYLKDNKIMLK